MQYRDFRSDTVTQPTEEMRQAMMEAVVGDDVLGEDPTVRELEETSASMFGKQAALFVVSGTMANQVAIMALTQLGDEIIVGEESHIYNLEVGGLAASAGVQARPLAANRGRFDLDDLRHAIRLPGIQYATTRVLCLENSYSLNHGYALPASYVGKVAAVAHERGLQVYLDGARIFNAAAALKTDVRTLCRDVDALTFCLSKGLSAPIGALLVGSQSFIDRARWIRQRIGGGMRQAGHMAAAGLVGLRTMPGQLPRDHILAQQLSSALATLHPSLVKPEDTETNIVHLFFDGVGKTAKEMVDGLLTQGIKIKWIGQSECRMVVHRGIQPSDLEAAIIAIGRLLGQ